MSALGQVLTVDLAAQKPGESVTVTVSPSHALAVQVLNRIPFQKYKYNYSYLLVTKPIPALDPSVFGKASAPGLQAENPACDSMRAALNKLEETDDESQVRDLRGPLKAAYGQAANASCDQKDLGRAALALADLDYALDERFDLKAGQALEITVTRSSADGSLKTWKKTFDTGDRGRWITAYGFTFLPNQDEEWFSKATDDPNKFLVTEKANRHRFDFAPSVFFTWIPSLRVSSNLDIGPTAGLGFDLSAPLVFAGASLLWNENVALVGGVVLHQRTRLAGEFSKDQPIKENLNSDRLTTKSYTPAGFFGLAFRFGSKPTGFGETTSAQPVPAKGSPTPAPTDTGAAPASPTPSAGQPAPARQATAPSSLGARANAVPGEITVWVNSSTGVYHCPGTRFFQKTKRGTLMTERDAESKGFRPAYGKRCGAD